MKMNWNKYSSRKNRQKGVTLIELMVAMVISLVVSTTMILLMANTIGTGRQVIQMTLLTQEMRTAMQLMTRDLRRANYHSSSASCYGNLNCNPDVTKIAAITPLSGGTCFRFWYNRLGDGSLDVGTFQLFSGARNGESINVLQVTTADDADSTCGDDWGAALDISNAEVVNVSAFTVSNNDSYCSDIGVADSQVTSKIRLTMTAGLRNTPQGVGISKTIEDLVYIRNPVFSPGSTCS